MYRVAGNKRLLKVDGFFGSPKTFIPAKAGIQKLLYWISRRIASGGDEMRLFQTFYDAVKAVALCFFLSLTLSCATGTYRTLGLLDTPGQHVRSGFTLVQKKYLTDAEREFSAALQLDPSFAEAHRGLGIVYLMGGRYGEASDALENALKYTSSDRVTALVHVAFIRLHTGWKGENWAYEAADSFVKAIVHARNLPDAYYYMGMAFKANGDFALAAKAFERVLEMNSHLSAEAEWSLNEVRRILRQKRD